MFDPADPSDPADPGGGIGSFLETGMVMGLDGPLTGKLVSISAGKGQGAGRLRLALVHQSLRSRS